MEQCPLCLDNLGVSPVQSYGEYATFYCSVCQLQFASPMQDPGEDFYKDFQEYVRRSCESNPAVGNEMASRDWRFKTFFTLCDPHDHLKVLDIGCGEGKFLALARSKGFEVYGIDLDQRATELARTVRGLQNVESGHWDTVLQRKGWEQFDVVTLFDVLEHVASPISMVTTIFNLLKPGGSICISVPSLDRRPRIFDVDVDTPPHHLTLWTERALQILLIRLGFKKIAIVRRPLMVEDFLVHARWGTRRLVRRCQPVPAPARGNEGAPALPSRGRQLLQLMIRRPVDWFLRKADLGRGFTLLAYATKPSRD